MPWPETHGASCTVAERAIKNTALRDLLGLWLGQPDSSHLRTGETGALPGQLRQNRAASPPGTLAIVAYRSLIP